MKYIIIILLLLTSCGQSLNLTNCTTAVNSYTNELDGLQIGVATLNAVQSILGPYGYSPPSDAPHYTFSVADKNNNICGEFQVYMNAQGTLNSFNFIQTTKWE
jgi:hypothetical protein